MTIHKSPLTRILQLSMPFIHPVFIIAVLIAISIHECAHAYAAYKLGDDTAKWEGRLTLNPLSHLDLLGAILFLTVGFGWAKPVPVNPLNLKHPKRDMAIIAVAGPLSNLILAFLCFTALQLLFKSQPDSFGELAAGVSGGGSSVGSALAQLLLLSSVMVNLGLMAFNLLPIPPLDGSNILRMFIPWKYEAGYLRWMQQAPMVLLVILILESFTSIRILSGFVDVIVTATLTLFSVLLGGL